MSSRSLTGCVPSSRRQGLCRRAGRPCGCPTGPLWSHRLFRFRAAAFPDGTATLTAVASCRMIRGRCFRPVDGSSADARTRFWSHPFSGSLSQAVTPPVVAALFVLAPAALVTSVTAVVVRFARSAGEERLQLKWFAAAAVLVVATFIPSMVTDSVVAAVLSNLAFLCLWVAIGVAVLKYRLYEIDIVISKAVLYGSLAVFITAVYAGLVVVLPQMAHIAAAGTGTTISGQLPSPSPAAAISAPQSRIARRHQGLRQTGRNTSYQRASERQSVRYARPGSKVSMRP